MTRRSRSAAARLIEAVQSVPSFHFFIRVVFFTRAFPPSDGDRGRLERCIDPLVRAVWMPLPGPLEPIAFQWFPEESDEEHRFGWRTVLHIDFDRKGVCNILPVRTQHAEDAIKTIVRAVIGMPVTDIQTNTDAPQLFDLVSPE